MRIALVHELLTMKGGAERVLRVLADLFPDAPIYTLLYDEKTLGDWFPRERVRPAPLSFAARCLPARLRHNHHLYLRRFPRMVEHWNFDAYDTVISTSSAFTHGIITNGKPQHLCYVNAPARYLWDRTHDVQERASRGLLGSLRRAHLSRAFHALRIWDSEAAARPDKLLAASASVRRRIELYWRRESDILHPPIDDAWLTHPLPSTGASSTPPSYLLVSSLVPYKRIDLAIEACNRLGARLTIAGTGPAQRMLRRMAGPTVTFRGYVPHDELRTLYAGATATLFPGDEDFGLVPLESMACGTPVIALRGGGALETVIENTTGLFFDEPTAASLADAITRCEQQTFDAAACRTQAARFSRQQFEAGMRTALEQMQRSAG